MRLGFALRTALSLLFLGSPAIAQTVSAPADWRAVDRAVAAALDSSPHPDSLARERRAWSRLDAAVVASLNARLAPDSINRILARRPGYQGPTSGQMTLHTASATFWRELPRNAPSFYVASLDERTPEIVVGVFELVPFVNGPSALSVYARVGGVWQRSAGFRSDRLIAVYPIPSGDNTRAIATIETWIRADGSESELKLWKLDGNTLHRIRRADTTRFQDAEVTPTDSSVVFAVAQFPRVVDACTMCTRLDEQHEFLLVRDSVVEREYWLNPWAVIVERLYGYLARRQIAAARRLLADSADVGPLVRHHAEPEFWADSGDFERGEGFAIVLVAMPDACPSEWRIDSRRQADNSWRIVSARLGVWDGDKQQFTVRPKNELPRICS